MTKLALSVDADTVALAKALAAEQGTTVSALFARFVHAVAAKRYAPLAIGRLTKRVAGIVAMPKGPDARAVLEAALLDRHGPR